MQPNPRKLNAAPYARQDDRRMVSVGGERDIVVSPDFVRNWECAYYLHCLDIAATGNWRSFSCDMCGRRFYTKLDPENVVLEGDSDARVP